MEIRTFGTGGAALVGCFACTGAGICSWGAGTNFFFVFLGTTGAPGYKAESTDPSAKEIKRKEIANRSWGRLVGGRLFRRARKRLRS